MENDRLFWLSAAAGGGSALEAATRPLSKQVEKVPSKNNRSGRAGVALCNDHRTRRGAGGLRYARLNRNDPASAFFIYRSLLVNPLVIDAANDIMKE